MKHSLEAVTRAAAAKNALKTVLDSQAGMNALLQREESFHELLSACLRSPFDSLQYAGREGVWVACSEGRSTPGSSHSQLLTPSFPSCHLTLTPCLAHTAHQHRTPFSIPPHLKTNPRYQGMEVLAAVVLYSVKVGNKRGRHVVVDFLRASGNWRHRWATATYRHPTHRLYGR